jgi:hypothetical protein
VEALWAGAAYVGVAVGPVWLLIPAAVAIGFTALFRRPAPVYAY